ncbi:MAG: 3-oxoacyl-ACP reductase FabG [Pseudomonadaceae bacterium]|nr:3-oxoacyl-ACP reductase FabG [Pseudomonadaceae bacterium]
MSDTTGKLAGQVALVTGAARYRGLGRAIALRLADDGADVVVTGRPAAQSSVTDAEREMGWQGASSLAGEIEAKGRRALALEFDVTDADAVETACKQALETMGCVDILVNNAGVPSGAGAAPVLDMDDELWYSTVDVNLNGVYLVTKWIGRAMRDAGKGGSIINLSSTAGRRGLPAYGAYCASKFAVVGLTQQLATELARFNIRVNCIAPGSHPTDMMDGTIARTADVVGATTDQITAGIRAAALLGRQGKPEELAASVSFLAGPDAAFITGQTLNVDGGAHMS